VYRYLKNKTTGELISPYNGAGDDLKVTNAIAATLRARVIWLFVQVGLFYFIAPLCITSSNQDEGLAIIKVKH
jgi:taurine--2-oxoglutarate transaminase